MCEVFRALKLMCKGTSMQFSFLLTSWKFRTCAVNMRLPDGGWLRFLCVWHGAKTPGTVVSSQAGPSLLAHGLLGEKKVKQTIPEVST